MSFYLSLKELSHQFQKVTKIFYRPELTGWYLLFYSKHSMDFGLEEKFLQTSLQKAGGFAYFTYHQRLPFRKQPNLNQ
jgi:hypothetical protein